ncbi:sulfotransferase family 2 domain-containing protein [Desulfovibrio sp. JC022]|uniref:sulfotransferase family 2 domain-containing protein n=1 Tax=Desulfovibrio sp. JC022 TaxID=2593642 RepID=UPI0013D3A4A3|nr:sulfotransferase family 2 domain-containing protein [Desulfovibrio sp. JC022]NDV22157.1 sulfotransferase family protein [Desulfovibrio sp. JC022]
MNDTQNNTPFVDFFCKSVPFNLVMLRRKIKDTFFLDPRCNEIAETEIGEYIRSNMVLGNYKYSLYSDVSGHIKVSKKNKMLFVNIGKNASSKVLQTAIEELTGKKFSNREEYMWYRDHWYGHVEKEIKIEKEITSLIADPSYFKFTFVRNPYSRLVSAWKNRIQDKSSIIHNIGYYRDIRKYSFAQLVDFLYEHKDDSTYFDRHWWPQHIAMFHPLIEYDFVGKIENFNGDYAFVLKKINASENAFNSITQKVNATKPSRLMSFYTDELQAKVYEIYKKDFDLLGYSYELPQ